MKLRAWRLKEGLTYSGAARALGLKNAGQVHKYENGRVPDPPQMELIRIGTNDKVQPNDFHDKPPVIGGAP